MKDATASENYGDSTVNAWCKGYFRENSLPGKKVVTVTVPVYLNIEDRLRMKEWLMRYAPAGSSYTIDFSNRQFQLGFKAKGTTMRLGRKSYSWEARGLQSFMSCSLD
eukprot:5841282-Amphidinium_carterae.7